MKKILLFTLLLANFFFANAFTSVSTYRWRNDNGTETNATWKAAINTPIQINNFDAIRIRMAIDNLQNTSVPVNAQLEFSSDDGQNWQNITVLESPFNLVNSPIVNDRESTTSQISNSPLTYIGGLFKSTDSNTTFDLPAGSTTEHEFCLKPNSQYIEASVTYTFRIINIGSSVFPAISYCPTHVDPPLANTPQYVNAGSKVSDLQALGTDLKWYSAISGGSELSPTETLSSGLYYVSQTLSCESTRTEVKVNIINGSALNFAGGYVDLLFNMPSTYTKEAWINVRDFSKVNNIISGGDLDGKHVIYMPGGILSAGHNDVWNSVEDTEPLDTDTWYHVALTYDLATTTMKLYKNGVFVDENNQIGAFVGNTVKIGAFGSDNLFNGAIDEVRIWNKVLTEAEINDKKNCEFAGPQPGLVGYYKFNQGLEGADNSSITSLTDSSGNGNDGTFVNFDLSENSINWITNYGIQTGNTCTTLSVGNHDLDFTSSLKVYPNPSNNAFFINSDSNGTVVIFDILGKIIKTQKINSGTTTLDLGSTPNGVYLLKVTNEKNESKTVKLIKN
jgi:hypothetical protein